MDLNRENLKDKIYIHIGADILLNYIKPVENEKWSAKPLGGFWSSPYAPSSEDNFKCDWERFLAQENYIRDRANTYFLFKLKNNANILKLQNKRDIEFCRKQGFILDEGDIVILDFELISKSGYDGIYYEFNDYLQYLIRGWDCDSLVLFNLDKIKVI